MKIGSKGKSGQRENREKPYVNLNHINHYARINKIKTRSTIGGGRGCNKFIPVLGGNGIKTAPTGNIFDQLPGQMR